MGFPQDRRVAEFKGGALTQHDIAHYEPAMIATPPHERQVEPTAARRKRLLVVLPALNEAASIREIIHRIPATIPGIDEVEILVVDDGSTDDTVALSLAAGASVISHGKNRGVGAAMQTGIDEAVRRQVDYAVNIDSDGQFAPEDIPVLLAPVLEGRADFATASRFKDPSLVPQMPTVKRWGNRGMSRIVSTILGAQFHDVSCGFRAYSRETLLQLVLSGAFTYTQESFLVLGQRGLRLQEIPLPVRGVREHGKSRVASNILLYALKTSWIIFGFLRDYSPGLFFNFAAAVFAFLGLGFATFFVAHRIVAGQFTPHIWSGFVAGFLLTVAFVVFALGQVASMIARVRHLQEKQLYIARKYLERAETER
jgi:glycosyltransferase involved in cell wall biosynthesis